MVLDEQGEPIIGANIVEKGTTNGTITDIDGNYTLTLNDLKKAVLQFSFIGYNTLEEGVKGRNKVDVKLAPSVVNLGEVVAIGYGTQTRKEITGSPRKTSTRVLIVMLQICYKVKWLVCRLLLALVM